MGTRIYRGNEADIYADFEAFKSLEYGYAPFWIDARTYGFVQENSIIGGRATQVFTASVVDDAPELLVSSQELWDVMPVDERPSMAELLLIKYVVVYPQNRDLFFIGAVDFQSRIYLFSYDRATLAVKLRLELDADSNHSLGFSPDGRYLIATGVQPKETQGLPGHDDSPLIQTLFLHDIERNTTQTFMNDRPFFAPSQSYDWSADGRWLIIPINEKAFNLVAPAQNYQQILPHNLGNCTGIAFINR